MKRFTFSVAFLLLLTTMSFADPGHESPLFSYDSAEKTVQSELFDGADNYDADVVSLAGSLWFAWLEFAPGEGDRIFVGQREDDWRVREVVVDCGAYANPTLTVSSTGRLWLTYESENGAQWDVYALPLDAGRPLSKPKLVSSSRGSDINHRAAADEEGGIWLVWQMDNAGQFDIVARRVTETSIGKVETVCDDPHSQWRPAIASRGAQLHVVWDGYNGNDFDVSYRCRNPQGWSQVEPVADSPGFEGRADVSVDQRGRAWIAWEEGAVNWGKPFRGIDTSKISDQHGPLHRFRMLRLAVKDQEGLWQLDDPLPMPSLSLAEARRSTRRDIKRSGVFYERPRIFADASDRIWLVYRHNYTPWLGVNHHSHVEGGWGVFARCYGADGWSPLVRFDTDQGDGMQRLELTGHSDGIVAVWTAGRTHRQPIKRPRGIASARVAGHHKPVDEPPLAPRGKRNETAGTNDSRPRVAVESEGKTYQLFYGDLHRHTDLSLCRVPLDGTIEDAYRYAIDVAQLDFLGITDHARDLSMGNALSQVWWRSRKEVYRHQLPPSFFPFYAFERSHGKTADHNVISLRSDVLRPHNYPISEYWKELDHDTITIPHQPIRRDTWEHHHEQLRPLVEIYQGCRDTSIAKKVHSGLGKGYLLGFIASSDHMATSASYACVWAEEATRESIFRAMQARRTYGATANIQLRVQAGKHWMGEKVPGGKLPPVELEATGTASIRSVRMIVDGKEVKSFFPNQRDLKLQVEAILKPGQYIYFHLVQTDGNQAWSSPIWVGE